MNKQAYYKLMGLQKRAGNIAGPFLGAMSGMAAADWLAQIIHNNPGFWTRLLYDIPGAYLGIHAGNKLQNKLMNTNRGAFWDKEDTDWLQKVIDNAERKTNLQKDKIKSAVDKQDKQINEGTAYV